MKPAVPWDFSFVEDGTPQVPNEPSDDGRVLGAQMARLADIAEAEQRQQFPDMLPRCDDCALREGTEPNGCVATLMDVLKCALECKPFFCHKGVKEGAEPRRLCTGAMVLMGHGALAEAGKQEEP